MQPPTTAVTVRSPASSLAMSCSGTALALRPRRHIEALEGEQGLVPEERKPRTSRHAPRVPHARQLQPQLRELGPGEPGPTASRRSVRLAMACCAAGSSVALP